MYKNIIIALLVLIIIVGAFVFLNKQTPAEPIAQESISIEGDNVVGDGFKPSSTEQENDSVMEGTVAYTVDPEASTLEWYGERTVVGGNKHRGVVDIQSGTVYVTDAGEIVGGSFTVDMTTIAERDSDGSLNAEAMVVNHLKTDDFFSVETYPTATFDITSVTALEVTEVGAPNASVTGDLTIKGNTHEITFPATINEVDDMLVADAEFSIDRTTWDIRYGSDKFFAGLGDKIIADEIEYTLHIVAEEQLTTNN